MHDPRRSASTASFVAEVLIRMRGRLEIISAQSRVGSCASVGTGRVASSAGVSRLGGGRTTAGPW